MRFTTLTTALFTATALLGCDWGAPGSSLGWSQTARTWEAIASGNCLSLGSYVFAIDTTTPPFQGKVGLQMQTEFRDDQEFLPPFVDLNWYLNSAVTPFYAQQFELRKGKGSLSEVQPIPWNYDAGDEIRAEICAGGGGTIPIHTEIRYTAKLRFDF
jgi:hypothetical protein